MLGATTRRATGSRSVPQSNPDESARVADVRRTGEQAIATLTPEQMRRLAELLYAMLRDDARRARARSQDEPLRR